MSISSTIRVLITGEAKGIHESLVKTEEELKHVGKQGDSTSQKLTKFSKAAVLGFAAVAVAVAAYSIKAGDELSESQDQLAVALKNSHQHVGNLSKALGPVSAKMEKFGYTNREVDDSIASFTRSGIKLKDAIKDEAIAADIAKAKHIDLGTATTLVAKASEGQIKGLKALAIDLPVAAGGALKLKTANEGLAKAHDKLTAAQSDYSAAVAKGNFLMADAVKHGLKGKELARAKSVAEDKAATLEEAAAGKVKKAQDGLGAAQRKVNDAQSAGTKIMGALASRMKGSAEESTKSLAGKTAALKAKFTDMAAHLGQKLIPIVLKLGLMFGGLVDYFSHNKAALIALIAVVGLFVAAMVTLTIIDTVKKLTEAWTKAQAALNAVMDANPVVLVSLAVVALGVAIYEAYKHFGPFHRAVDAVWQALQIGFDWVKSHWPLLLAILTGPIGIAVYEIAGHWSAITNGAKNVVHSIGSFFSGIPDRVTGALSSMGDHVVSFFAGLPHRIASAVAGMFDGVKGAFKAAVNWIIGKWNDLSFTIGGGSVFGHKLPSVTIGTPNIPYLANGAIVSSATLAMIGEAGREMVLPLDRPARARQLVHESGVMSGRGGGSLAPIVQHIYAIDVHQAMRVAAHEQAWASKTGGR